ncbi:Uncharacterised protein [uncultured archaeon]|nr:Uncharacterised protein [uncultured archaeon]
MITILENHYTFDRKPVNRIILGEKMQVPESNINIFGDTLNMQGEITGSIGFFDYLIADTLIPTTRESDSMSYQKTMRIPFLGIEPEYQRQGYFLKSMRLLEEIAQKQDCSAITIEVIKNPFLFIWGNRHGYKPYWDYKNILKYLGP